MVKCDLAYCDRPVRAMGLCSAHYQQKRAGKEFTPLRPHVRIPQPTRFSKVCTVCLTEKAVSEFYIRDNGVLHSWCKSCTSKVNNERNRRRMNGNASTASDIIKELGLRPPETTTGQPSK